jgi:hypothetical protein
LGLGRRSSSRRSAKAPGRIIGRWKQEAIAANAGASDEDLAKIINDMARKQGFDYTITPEKVRAKSKKKRRRKAAGKAAPAAVALATPGPAPRAVSADKISMEDVHALKGLVDRVGADNVKALASMLSK